MSNWSKYKSENRSTTLVAEHTVDAAAQATSIQFVRQFERTLQEKSRQEPWKQRRRFKPKNYSQDYSKDYSKFHSNAPSQNKAYANVWRRTIAHIIDWIVVSLIGACLVGAAAFVTLSVENKSFYVDTFNYMCIVSYGFFIYALGTVLPLFSAVVPLAISKKMWTYDFNTSPVFDGFLVWAVVCFALLYVLPPLIDMLYRACMESSSTQATLGKMFVRIYVADEDGDRITFGSAITRNIGKVLVVFSLVRKILNLKSEEGRQFHDTVTRTCVLTEVDNSDSITRFL